MPLPPSPLLELPPPERFLAHTSLEPASGCLLWTGCINRSGYGVVLCGDRSKLAHRVAWALKHGDPGSAHVLHRCDVRACVAVEHLFLGTHRDNMLDMHAKSRHPVTGARGVKHYRATLTPDIVRAIRSARESGQRFADIGRAFSLSPIHVRAIANRVIWKHVN